MDLDSRAYSKILLLGNRFSDVNFEEYQKILEALCLLDMRYDYKTPKMWYFRIRDPFRKILKENPRFLSKNRYITIHGNLYGSSGREQDWASNYIYCSIYNSLVFIPETAFRGGPYRDNHFKSCINGDTISKEYVRREEIL